MNEETPAPILYIRPSCPDCDEAVAFLAKHDISYEKKDVSRDPIALLEMQHKSRQPKTPVLDWHGRLLANFGLDKLKAFLLEQNVAFPDSPAAATAPASA